MEIRDRDYAANQLQLISFICLPGWRHGKEGIIDKYSLLPEYQTPVFFQLWELWADIYNSYESITWDHYSVRIHCMVSVKQL